MGNNNDSSNSYDENENESKSESENGRCEATLPNTLTHSLTLSHI